MQLKSLFSKIGFILIFTTTSMLAQYPSDAQMIADVKSKDPKAFITVKPVGQWKMFHDNIPEWKPENACEKLVEITGSKKADGTWWSYKGFAIYKKVGANMVFDRVFLDENETRLNGINLPDNTYFEKDFINRMNARDPLLIKGNTSLLDATNFYSYKLVANPRATGTSEQVVVFATFVVVYDAKASNTSLQKQSRKITLKYNMNGKELQFQFGMRAQGEEFFEKIDFGDKTILESIPKFENSGKTIQEMTNLTPNYPKPKGSNGASYPNDNELIKIAENTFLTKADNFKMLFGEKGLKIIMEVTFKTIDGRNAESTNDEQFSKDFYCDFKYFDADDAAKKLTECIGQREMKFFYKKDGGSYVISNAKVLTETKSLKKESLNYSNYINTVRSKTYASKFGMK